MSATMDTSDDSEHVREGIIVAKLNVREDFASMQFPKDTYDAGELACVEQKDGRSFVVIPSLAYAVLTT